MLPESDRREGFCEAAQCCARQRIHCEVCPSVKEMRPLLKKKKVFRSSRTKTYASPLRILILTLFFSDRIEHFGEHLLSLFNEHLPATVFVFPFFLSLLKLDCHYKTCRQACWQTHIVLDQEMGLQTQAFPCKQAWSR